MTLRRTFDVSIRPDISGLFNRIDRTDHDDAINLVDSGDFSCRSDHPVPVDAQWEANRSGLGLLRQDLPLQIHVEGAEWWSVM